MLYWGKICFITLGAIIPIDVPRSSFRRNGKKLIGRKIPVDSSKSLYFQSKSNQMGKNLSGETCFF
jgi:hypothetical protein